MITAEECKRCLLSVVENKYRVEFKRIEEDLMTAIHVRQERFIYFDVDLETKDIELFKEIILKYGFKVIHEVKSAQDNFSKVTYKIYF